MIGGNHKNVNFNSVAIKSMFTSALKKLKQYPWTDIKKSDDFKKF